MHLRVSAIVEQGVHLSQLALHGLVVSDQVLHLLLQLAGIGLPCLQLQVPGIATVSTNTPGVGGDMVSWLQALSRVQLRLCNRRRWLY